MARIKDPILFSDYFKINPDILEKTGLINPFIDVDTPLFIDPILISSSSNPIIAQNGYAAFREHFSKFIRLLNISRSEGDAAWKAARKLLDLSEPPETGLGYGGSGRKGASRPDDVRETIMHTCKEIISLGVNDPDMICLMGFFEEKVGPDTISDFITLVIMEQLVTITHKFCQTNGIKIEQNLNPEQYSLPIYKSPDGRKIPIVLVPRDIVRDLPIANDWSDVESAITKNEKIRSRVNALLGKIASTTIKDRKRALKIIATESKENFEQFLKAVKEHASFYDPREDSLAYYKVKSIIAQGFDDLKPDKSYQIKKGPEEIVRLVHDTIDAFKHHVEKGNLWEELWVNGKPKKERAAQLIYYAIADCYCRAHNVDISPEANMGGGPIDFKFSDGYEARILVEMKRSSGTVRHGYEKQLEIYKDASRTEYGIFVVMDYGKLGSKLKQIQKIRSLRTKAGERASDIIVIDARKKKSASKRK
jgi:hypothetical protein